VSRTIVCLILVTGSRGYRDRAAIRRTLLEICEEWGVTPQEIGVLHGGAGGADTLAGQEAELLGMYVADPVIPDWDTCEPDCPPHRKLHKGGVTTYCPTAGYRRNSSMVNRVAAFLARGEGRRAVCAVFRCEGKSNGTDDCTKRVQDAGIPLWGSI
jgi:hypothetical protein